MERVWLPLLRPETHTFPAFVERGNGAGLRRPTSRPAETRASHLVITVLVGILLGLAGACVYGALSTPATPWAFDRPEAKLAPPQPHRWP